MSRCDTPNPETLAAVPNQPRTPVRTFRLATDLWERLRTSATEKGMTVSDLLRKLVEDHLRSDK